MKKFFLLVICTLIISLTAFLVYQPSEKGNSKQVGIMVPLEHKAMDEILAGFKERVSESKGLNVFIEVLNAQGDINLQQAIIEKFSRQNKDLFASIGTNASLMMINKVKTGPVLGIDVTYQINQELAPNFTGVEETSIEPSYYFLKELFPSMKKVAMIYSASDKNYQMFKKFSEMASKDHIKVQGIMLQNTSDLYVLAKAIDRDVDLIFISKDHLAASGAPVLSKIASELKIPFVASDEGSILSGGTLALGNKEKDIGRKAGEIALMLLSGKNSKEIPVKPVVEMTLFIDRRRCQEVGIEENRLRKIAKKFHHPIQCVNEEDAHR